MKPQRIFWICLLLCSAVFAEPPVSVYLDLPGAQDYPAAICYLASLGQLIQYENPDISTADILVRTGMITQFEWIEYHGGYIDPHKRIYDWRKKLFQGQTLDLIRLCGIGYAVGYGKGGGGGRSLVKGADRVVLFNNEEDAVLHLKSIIAAGFPVQVHLDFFYVKDDAGQYYPFWASYPDEPSSHFVVIHGYDENYVYYTDNHPSDSNDVDSDGLPDGVGVPLPWNRFLQAWQATEDFPNDSNIKAGPWFMLYLTSGPILVSNADLLGYLYRDGLDGPENLQTVLQNIQEGQSPADCLTDSLRDRKTEMTPYMVQWLQDNQYGQIADLYSQMGVLWQSIRNTDTDTTTVTDALEQITDLLDESWELIEPLANLDYDIYPLAPANNQTLDSLDQITLRFIPDPYLKSIQLEVDPAGDFSNPKNIFKFKLTAGKAFYTLSAKDWLKILAKENNDQTLLWRIAGTGNHAASASIPQSLRWSAFSMTAAAPLDNAQFVSGSSIEFSFTAPSLAIAPAVEISATADFTDKKCLLTLPAPKGAAAVTLKNSVLAKFLLKDNGDNILYWRIIDKGAAKTTVQPSETRAFIITTP